ncbi:MAG: hypothetical protein ACD_49C00067G0045 [uncultured bacterium (gcode 4)]|uniref:Uncharacterized protein n=1 Tax=uncultured bacterium (gcode 4) TaxID=1234023 RepID=K2BUZ9_9BACT|nr:MAG: hypothetical protein ACD_49C00067G0045 [uncultured bacterium (gcode 4)]
MLKKFFSWVFIILWISFFYIIGNSINYPVHQDIKYNLISHPEFIPTKNVVKLSSAGFYNIVSDFYWLDTIQYIGSNAVSSEYKKYLYPMLNLITDINPNFTQPYLIWELLLTSYNERYENISKEEIEKNVDQAMALWLKWIEKNCDLNKIALIKNEYDLKKLWTEEKYKNPCSDSQIPYYLAYIYHWNKFDSLNASLYYKVTSANTDAPTGARIMAAIMQWKWWDREKSIIMFLSLAESLSSEKEKSCSLFSKDLWDVLLNVFSKKMALNWKSVSEIDKIRGQLIKKLWEDNLDKNKNLDNFCSTYLNKATRELNLYYLENADKLYFTDKKNHAQTPEDLFKAWFIDYIPLDFQRDKDFQIIYFYNDEIKNWDYKAGN